MGRPLEISGYIMAGFIEKNRRTVAKLRNLLWDNIDKYKDRPEMVDMAAQFGRLVDDIDYSTENQWDIARSNGLADADLVGKLRQLADDLENGT